MKEELDDYFEYKIINTVFTEEEILKNYKSSKNKAKEIVKNWSEELNSQWVARSYIAVKMILSSTVLLTSVKYAKERNLRIVEPFLNYYAILNCARAVILTSPFTDWNNKEIFTMTHKKIINVIGDIISKYNKDKGQEIKEFIDWAREYREIFSYKFPANGLTKHHLSTEDIINNCKLLCEVAQFQSKILENSITKYVTEDFDLNWEILSIGYLYGETNFQFFDDEDGYRLNYIIRKQKRPFGILQTMTEGMTEDFFGAWCTENESNPDEDYNPDADWQIIFPIT